MLQHNEEVCPRQAQDPAAAEAEGQGQGEVSDEADTLDHLWTTPRSSVESELRGDLQRVCDELRELLMAFHAGSLRGDRVVRTAELNELRLYDLHDLLTELRAKHQLADRG